MTTYFADGKKEASGKVKKHEKQGSWKYWDENGNLIKVIHYVNDAKSGLYTEYYSNGKKATEGNYQWDFKSGTWTSWFSDGKLKSTLFYGGSNVSDSANAYTGIQQWWCEQGEMIEQANYDSKNRLMYRWIWYSNGRPKKMEYYEFGLANGTWRTYLDSSATDTAVSMIENFSQGKRNGVQRTYKNGILVEEKNYRDDLLNGKYFTWDSKGLPLSGENYTDGNLDGECIYYSFGKVIRIVHYENGKKGGIEKQFDSSGKPTTFSWYKSGRIDSMHTFHANGNLAIARVYSYFPGFVRTEEFSAYTEWDEVGHLLLSGKYHFDQKDQDWTTYYPTGKIKSVTSYSAGKIKGTYKKWYANGKEMIEYDCDGTNAVSTPKVWDEKGKPMKAGTKAYQEIVDSSLPGEIYNDPNQDRDNHNLNLPR